MRGLRSNTFTANYRVTITGLLLLFCGTDYADTLGTIPDNSGSQSQPGVDPTMLQQIINGLMPSLLGSQGLNSTQLNDIVPLIMGVMNQSTKPINITGGGDITFDSNNTNTDVGNGQIQTSTYSSAWTQCTDDILLMMQGILNEESWAVQMFDASAKPGHSIMKGNYKFMGNSDECQEVSHTAVGKGHIEGNICRLYLYQPYNIIRSKLVPVMPPIEWDVCVPKSCQDGDIKQALGNLFQRNLPSITVLAVQCTEDLDISGDARGIVAITILSLFVTMLVAGTVLDAVISTRNSGHKYETNSPATQSSVSDSDNTSTNNHGHVNTSFIDNHGREVKQSHLQEEEPSRNIEATPTTTMTGSRIDSIAPRPPLWQRVLLAFSIPRNAGRVMAVKAHPGSIGCLHGIRVLSLAWVILGHTLYYGIILGNIKNPLKVLSDMLPSTAFQFVISAYFAVDTFFVLSGLLTCYVFLSKLGTRGRMSLKEFILYYVHRYWRLTPSLMMWIMIVACLLKYVGEGRPAWSDYTVSGCKDRWWTNLLYINNLEKKDPDCMGITWYLACDMQFYWIAPLALIPWLLGKWVFGFIVSVAFLCVHILTTLGLELKYEADNFKNAEDYNEYIYFKPYARVGPYALGLMLGWVLWKTKCQVKINKGLVFLGWMICFGVLLVLSLIKADDIKDWPQTSWPKEARIFYETVSRPLWAVCISWIVFACATGHGGYINSILSWDGWLPLSRFSYSGYLVHMTIIYYEALFPEYRWLLTMTSLSYKFIGYFVMSYAVGFLLTIAVEAPALALEKVFLQ